MPRKPNAELASNPPISLRLPPEIRAAVVKLADKERRSLSAQIVHLVEVALAGKSDKEAAAGGE